MNTPRRLRLDLNYYYRLPSVQVSLGIVLAFFIIAFFIIFAIRPTFSTIVKLQREIEESSKTLVILDTKVKNLDQATQILNRLNNVLPKLMASVPGNGVGYGELSRSLEVMAQESGVLLDTFTLGESLLMSRLSTPFESSKNQTPIELPITIKVSGSYLTCTDFLSKISNNLRLANLDGVTITKDGAASKSSTETKITMTITGKVYYLADKVMIEKVLPTQKGGK